MRPKDQRRTEDLHEDQRLSRRTRARRPSKRLLSERHDRLLVGLPRGPDLSSWQRESDVHRPVAIAHRHAPPPRGEKRGEPRGKSVLGRNDKRRLHLSRLASRYLGTHNLCESILNSNFLSQKGVGQGRMKRPLQKVKRPRLRVSYTFTKSTIN